MKRVLIKTILAASCLAILAGVTEAQRRGSLSSFAARRQVILRIQNRSNLFRNSLQSWTANNPSDSYAAAAGEDINIFVRDFDDSVRQLNDRFQRRESTTADVQDVLNRGARVDAFMQRHMTDLRTRNYWSAMRIDLNQLARSFGLSWNTARNAYPGPDNQALTRLTGTYRIDTARSDDARMMAERAVRDVAPSERPQVLDLLTRRLESPYEIAMDVRGRSVTMASSRARQVTFVADGRDRIETNPNGRTIHTTASLNGDQLIVSTSGDSGSDFNVTFDPIDNGQRLSVTRRVYAPTLSRPVVVQSTYVRTADVARFDIYNPQAYPTSATGFVVPDGTRIVAVLNDTLSTRTAAVGDRFMARVSGPVEFEGAMIEGHVSHIERSGRLTGRSLLTLNFDQIRLRDGRTYQFAGIVESVRSRTGELVRVDTEGTVSEESQTKTTEQRAAIGTAVGAIIGAIAGGGKGAAIGAILGAGGGAGSVYAQGRDDLDLDRGTTLTIRAGAPANIRR